MVKISETILGEKDFFVNAQEGKVAPIICRLKNCEVAPSSALSVLQDCQPVCLLESAGGSPQLTKYSFLGLSPLVVFKYKNSQAQIIEKGKCYCASGNPFLLLRQLLQKLSPQIRLDLPIPFWGGAMGLLSYDAGRYIEDLPTIAVDDLLLPELYFVVPEVLLAFNHMKRDLYIIINKLVGPSARKSLDEAQQKMDNICVLLNKTDKEDPYSRIPAQPPVLKAVKDLTPASNIAQPEFEKTVERIQEYIRAGDVYQVNISQRLQVPCPGNPFSLYRKLKKINPSPFASYLDCGDFQLASSSPERLIQLRGRIAQTRPIAGTRRRGEDFTEDSHLSTDLILDEKERAEHVMLVDLERNDLGRVCEYGSVTVDELMVLEKYSHVIHIVSNVRGVLGVHKDQFDLIQAMFPGGTITGCPKVRCMEIIEELEPVRRGPYTGSIGYFGFNGNMDMNIIIRTFVIKGRRAYIQVGAGIVIDSKPNREYFETLSKADALLAAVGCRKEVKKWEKLPL